MNPGPDRDPADTTRAIPTPYVISVAGIPGSGKTTLFDRVLADLSAEDLDVGTLPPVKRTDREPHYREHHPEFWELSRALINATADDQRTRTRRALWWFVSAHRVEQAQASSVEGQRPVFVEEPMIHEVWRLSHWLGHTRFDEVLHLAERVPGCELLFHVRTGPSTARRRILSKGTQEQGPINRDLSTASPDDAVWHTGLEIYNDLLAIAGKRSEVVDIDNDQDEYLDRNVATMVSHIAQHAQHIERGWLGRSVRSLRNGILGRSG